MDMTPPGEASTLAEIWHDRHPSIVAVLQFLDSRHLPDRLREAAQPIEQAAHKLMRVCPDGPELTVALRKLLEAKDCAVRALL